MAFGGPYFPFSTMRIPDWFPKEYGLKTMGTTRRVLSETEFVSGSNMVFQVHLLKEIGGFNAGFGMAGHRVAYGEEVEVQFRLRRQNVPIHYDPSIKVDHAILPHKLSLRWLLKSAIAVGVNAGQILPIGEVSLSSLLLRLARQTWRSAIEIVRNANEERKWKAKLYRALSPLLFEFGYAIGSLSRR